MSATPPVTGVAVTATSQQQTDYIEALLDVAKEIIEYANEKGCSNLQLKLVIEDFAAMVQEPSNRDAPSVLANVGGEERNELVRFNCDRILKVSAGASNVDLGIRVLLLSLKRRFDLAYKGAEECTK